MKNITRHSFLNRGETIGVILLSFLPGIASWAAENISDFSDGQAVTITPYDPAVKRRIVFTTWNLVSPGWFKWENRQGEAAGLSDKAEPDALIFHSRNNPYGIEIAVQPVEHIRRFDMPGAARLDTVLYHEGAYHGWGEGGEFSGTVRFISSDGYRWECVDASPESQFNAKGPKTVFIDPGGDPAERYKMLIGDRSPGPGAAVSADGIHWKELPEPILRDDSDTLNMVHYDVARKKYVLYHRKWRTPFPGASSDLQRRAIGRSESENFHHFPESQFILESAIATLPPNVDIYTNCWTTIPQAADIELMFPAIYHRDSDTTSLAMAASVDGAAWNFLPGGALLTTPDAGPGCGCFFAGSHLLEMSDGSFALHYVAYNVPHKYPRGKNWVRTENYALWPKGRIVALEAKEKGGFTMAPIPGAGKKLRINAVTLRAGSIRIELAENSKPYVEHPVIPGFSLADCDPIVGDNYRKIVSWKGLSQLPLKDGQPLVMRFEMDHAKIFSLELIN
jgi:hypothetical protein